MKKVNPATINNNRYRLLIDWRTDLNPGIATITLEADTLRAAKKEVLMMVCKDWYLARILECQNDVGVVNRDGNILPTECGVTWHNVDWSKTIRWTEI